MSHFPQTDSTRRAPRALLNGTIAAAIQGEGGMQARAKLRLLSINGGLLQMQNALSAGDFVEIAFHTRSGPVHAMAEVLPPTRKFQTAILQPFRFIALGDDDHRTLRMALESYFDRQFVAARPESSPAAEL